MTEHFLEYESGIRVTISDETGMPALPSGYYWGVEEGYFNLRPQLRVSLNRSRRRWFDCRIDCRYVDYLTVEGRAREFTLEQRVLQAAGNIYMDHRGMFAPDYKYEEALKLVGKYPPKKLHAEKWSGDDC